MLERLQDIHPDRQANITAEYTTLCRILKTAYDSEACSREFYVTELRELLKREKALRIFCFLGKSDQEIINLTESWLLINGG